MMRAVRCLVPCSLLLLWPTGVAAQTTSLAPAADTYLKSGSPNQSQGSETFLRVNSSGKNRALVRFDQATVAAAVGTGSLASASLELYVEDNADNWGADGRTVDVHRLSVAWTEAGATWNCPADGNPGNSSPDCAVQWAGGSFEEEPSDTMLHTNGLAGWVSFDVTADVQGFLEGAANHGWLVKKTEEGQNGRVDYTSRQGVAGQAPRLVLVVESATFDEVPPSLAVTAPPQAVVVNDPTPEIVVVYGDGGSGVDLGSLSVKVDDDDVTSSCVVGPASAVCEPSALVGGVHMVTARIADLAGNVVQASRGFELLVGPGMASATVAVVADTYLRQGQPNQNQGSEGVLRVRQSGKNRALLRVHPAEVAALVAGGTVHSARLELFIEENGDNWGRDGRTVDLHRLTASWSEHGATWNCADDADPGNQQADCDPQWNGGSFEAAPIGTVLITNRLEGWMDFDVTAEVVAMAAGGAHHGWLLKKADEALSGHIDCVSQEGAAAQRPQLVVMIEAGGTVDSTPPTVEITAPANDALVATATPTVTAVYADSGTGIDLASARLTVDGVDRTADAAVSITGLTWTATADLAEGGHTAVITVRDLAGNAANASTSFLTDSVPPTLVIVSPPDGAILSTASPQVEATFTDAGSGIDSARTTVLVETVDRSADAVLTEMDLTWMPSEPFSELPHAVEVIAYDRAGNSASAMTWFIVDVTPPSLTVEAPVSGLTVNLGQIEVSGDALDENGEVTVEVGGQPMVLTDGHFQHFVALAEGEQTLTIRAVDAAGNSREESRQVTRFTPPEVSITAPEDLSVLTATAVRVSGTVSDPAASVVVNGVAATVSGQAFTAANVPLLEGGNVITASVTDASGRRGTDTINVVRDLTAPRIAVHQPEDGSRVFDATVTVSGMVNDIVAGTVNASEATVTVNGFPATVSNRSFVALGVPLSPGDNSLAVVAVDQGGNRGSASVTVRRETAATARLAVVSGDLQEGDISTALAEPLVVAALDASGQPVASRPVLFAVIEGSGHFAGGSRQVVTTTGLDGQAEISLTLGTRAGVANHVVRASSPGFEAIAFRADARAGTPAFLLADAGTLQVGVAGQALPRPFVAVVTDTGFNRLPGVDVALRVVEGDGRFADGLAETVERSDSDGRIVVPFTLGPEEGVANNVVEAAIAGIDSSPKAAFVASGWVAGEVAATSISGVVLDNVNQPIPGVTLRIKEQPALTAQTDAQGQFRIVEAPVGTVHLIVDGSTASRPGSWPDLEFVVTTIPGRDVTVNRPIFLLPLDLAGGLYVDESRGGTLTLPAFPGFSLEVKPGSVTFPGGSRSGMISVTAVHSDKVPMVPNFGQQPRFIVTIQPAGALFEPPARLELPNLEGLAPGATTELYSFDHDLGHFVSIGQGSVSEDGLTIVSDPGVGLIKAGWHCGGDPAAAGTPADCPDCQICDGSACVPGCPLGGPLSLVAEQVDPVDLPQLDATKAKCKCTNPGEVCYKGKCTCAVPNKFKQVEGKVQPNGDLFFKYTWSSNTGKLSDLSACQVGEQVVYPIGLGSYTWPKPWSGSTPSPTVGRGPATAGFLTDVHESLPIVKPYVKDGFVAQQRYIYTCPCAQNGAPVKLFGIHPISRDIHQKPDGTWEYVITKTGQTGKKPLP